MNQYDRIGTDSDMGEVHCYRKKTRVLVLQNVRGLVPENSNKNLAKRKCGVAP